MTQNLVPLDAAIRAVAGGVLVVLAAWYNSAPLPAIGLAFGGLFFIETALHRN